MEYEPINNEIVFCEKYQKFGTKIEKWIIIKGRQSGVSVWWQIAPRDKERSVM